MSRKPQVGPLPGTAQAVSSAWHRPALSPNQAGPPPRLVPSLALTVLTAPWFCGTSRLASASWVQLNGWTGESHSSDRLGKSCQRRPHSGLEGRGDGNSRSRSVTCGTYARRGGGRVGAYPEDPPHQGLPREGRGGGVRIRGTGPAPKRADRPAYKRLRKITCK